MILKEVCMNLRLCLAGILAALTLAACAPSNNGQELQRTDRLIVGAFSGESSIDTRGELITALEDEGFKVLDAMIVRPPAGAAPYIVTGQTQFFRSVPNGQPDPPALIGSGLIRLTSLSDGLTARRYEFTAPTYTQAVNARGFARRLAKDLARDLLPGR
jgi:hypothetical protein